MRKKLPFPETCRFTIVSIILLFFVSTGFGAVPPNDSCGGAIPIVISNGGFGLGLFTGINTDLTSATLQNGETFAPSIIVAGLNKKSVWYKFTIPTTRAARISLAQPGSGIQAGNVGFAVYKSNTCIPGNAEISTKFSPIEIFGSSYHPCVEAGDYLVQVTSNLNANGPIFITVDLGEPDPAPYDKPTDAYKFANINIYKVSIVDYLVQCQSIDNAAENCSPNNSFMDYTKSTWQTFTTPAYFDYVSSWLGVFPGNYGTAPIKIGYRIYEGDATSTPLSSLSLIGGCDSIITDTYAVGKKNYYCGDLKPNTTYTIQLLFHKDFNGNIRVGIEWNGSKPTNGPLPVSSLAAPNKMGTLNADGSLYGVANNVADVFGCNSRHIQNNCPRSMPVNGVLHNGLRYNMSSFVSFHLATTSSVYFTTTITGCNGVLLRLYQQDLTANCTDLDTANLVATFDGYTYSNSPINCLPSGNYVLQVMGLDSAKPINIHFPSSLTNSVDNYLCSFFGLGSGFNVRMNVRSEVPANKFPLSATGKFDKINVNGSGIMQPLLPNTTYTAVKDTFGCANTVLPDSIKCTGYYGIYTKAAYREFEVADSFMFSYGASFTNSYYSGMLYKGDANALVTAQNVFAYPQKITGLTPYSNCLSSATISTSNQNACIIPGTYTFASFENQLGVPSNLDIIVTQPKTKHATPATAQDMGDLWSYIPTNTFYRSDADTFTCRDNPETIDGLAPCNGQYGLPANKLIYRQFYLRQPTLLTITNYTGNGDPYFGYGRFNLFKGKATDGINTLKAVGGQWTCFTNAASSGQCDALPAGWYTVVSYGSGPNYNDPLANLPNGYQASDLGRQNWFFVYIGVACTTPQFNRPYKASVDTVSKKPYLIEWGPQTGHTAAYPVTYKKYTLNTENFDCTQDTSFIRLNMAACNTDNVKVALYVFKITQESFVQIDGIPNGLWGSVYAFDVRTTDSTKLQTLSPLQTCLNKLGQIQFCRMVPGTYTLVFFAPASYICNTITPTIYIDQVGYSRFDHAINAYDFGTVKPDSSWYNGKPGDINPLNNGRAPSNDFFYCTTGSQQLDPSDISCFTQYNPEIYQPGTNIVLHPDNTKSPEYYIIDRRNLWYTFTVNQPGTIKVKVNNKTPGKAYQYPFAIYKSDVDGSLPFSSVIAGGLVDSTLLQGLTFMQKNLNYYCDGPSEISIYTDPCTFRPTRYYVLVENRNTIAVFGGSDLMYPNHQVEVSVLLDSVNSIPPKFDHFSQANDMGLVNSGIKKGEVDNFTCATKDLPDPLHAYTSCQKTLWYKFTTTTTGQIRYAAFFKNTNNYYYDHIQLFRQIKPNDSSATGLQHMLHTTTYYNDGYWAQQCISPGTYYIILPGCNAVNEDVYPQIEVIPQAGDFCSFPMVASLHGAGSTVVPVTIDCHTIGTDYGEFNPTLTCPANAITSNYKTSWYRLDITGADTLDVTVFINEKTNAGSTDIKYRMMTGNCGAMQEQSCVQDALTRNTYKCLAPGNSYYIQVFTPLTQPYSYPYQVTGDIDLNISAVVHADTCLPASACIGVANFTPQFDCTKDKEVIFTNFSTYGSSIQYEWDFGYNNQKSNAVSPRFFYPALTTDQTYTVKLVITNLLCGKKDSAIQIITIPARPAVNLGRDTVICANGSTLTLDATSHSGSTYYWFTGNTQSTLTVSGLNYNAWVEVTYGACKTRDTVAVFVNPVAKRALQTKALCAVTQVTLDASRGQGELYQWSTGASASSIVVSQPGIFWVDLYWNGCIVRDSFQVVSTSLRPLGNDTTVCQANMPLTATATVSGAASYSWQNNTTNNTLSVTMPGIYWVDINLGGCTFRDTLIVAVDSFKTANTLGRICQGQIYVLPSGRVINTAGIYKDSLKNSRGCDSIITTVTLAVDTVKRVSTSVSICGGQSYTLPGGSIVSVTGSYIDSVKNSKGCDSLISTINISIAIVSRVNKTAVICSGNSYTLPSGKLLSTTGTFTDTLKAKAGCDSLITTINLTVLTPIVNSIKADICSGQIYTLPSGNITTTGGIYKDTLRYVNGCDSVIRIVTVTVTPKPSLGADQSLSTCFGNTVNLASRYSTTGLTNTWTLNGAIVSNPSAIDAAGIYRLIAINAGGCADTALVTVSFNTKLDLGPDQSADICPGNAVDLTSQFNTTGLSANWTKSGVVVSSPQSITTGGIYQLIASNNFGCADTALFTITESPKPNLGTDKTMSICPGFMADLGPIFNTSGLSTNWSLSGVAVGNSTNVNIPGSYMLVAINTIGCSDTAIVTLNINTKPDIGVDKIASACSGNTINLTNQFSTAGLSATWSLGGNIINTASNIGIAGVYELIVTNSSACKDTAQLTVSINTKPTLGPDKSVTICDGNTVNLTTQFNTSGLAETWTLNGTSIGNTASVTTSGNYRLIVTSNSGCQDTAFYMVTNFSKPTIGPDKTLRICSGSNADLSIIFVTTGLTTNWTLNGAPVADPKKVFTAGVYQLIVSNLTGCTDTAFITLSIDQKPNAGNDWATTICAGTPIDLTTRFNTSGLVAGWTMGGVTVTTPEAINASGTYQLIAANSTGCTDTAFAYITFNSKPNMGADKTVSACFGSSIDLTKEYVTTGLSTSWSIAGNALTNPAAVTAPGIYQLIATNNFSCADTALVTVIVNQKPALTITNPTAVCTPSTVDLTQSSITAGSSNGLNYTYWRDALATAPLAAATNAPGGLYHIKGTDANGCFNIQPVTAVVYSMPVAMAGRDTTICDQSFALLRANATNLSGGTVSYLWTPATGLASPNTAATIARPGGSVTYTITATVNYGPCNLSATDDIRVNMQSPVSAFAGNDTIATVGVPFQLKATGGVNYLWLPSAPLNNAAIQSPMAILQQDTRFIVRVTDFAGCIATDTVFIKVYDGITYYLPNAFSPNGDGLNDIFRPVPVGIVSTDYFRIYSRYGQLVFETNRWMYGWDGTFKGQKQPVGNYIWVIKGMGSNGRVIEMKGNVVLVR